MFKITASKETYCETAQAVEQRKLNRPILATSNRQQKNKTMQNLTILFLQADIGSFLANYGILIAIFLIFYFFILRPQTQKQKKQDTFLQDLEKGKEVVTTSGILGKITKIDDSIITLEVGQKSYIRVTKGAISRELTAEVFEKEEA